MGFIAPFATLQLLKFLIKTAILMWLTGVTVTRLLILIFCQYRYCVHWEWRYHFLEFLLYTKKNGKISKFLPIFPIRKVASYFFSLIPSYGSFCGDSILLIYNFCYIVYSMRTVFIIVNRFFWNALFLCHNRFACFFSHFIYTIDN